jgi:hypothetical protein
MSEKKKMFFAKHSKSSAVLVSLAVHAVLIVAALSFVAVRIIIKQDQDFEVKEVKRPTMKLRKLQVPVKERKKTQAPKLRKTIVAKPKNPTVDIKMPEIVGVKGGTGYGRSGGLGGLGFDFNMDLFGSNKRGAGNEFIGHFFDLKQDPKGRLTDIGELVVAGKEYKKKASAKYYEVLQRFVSGWAPNRLNDYFMAPREKFATTFIVPDISADEAPKAFGVEDQVKPMKWIALYTGQIAAPETGKYRFCGGADDVMVVRVKKDVVLDASLHNKTGWKSSDPDSGKFSLYKMEMVIGDWMYLKKGEAVSMEVLLGEEPGGRFYCQLYIQQDGVEYATRSETYTDPDTNKSEVLQRPILPVFKTADIPDELARKMGLNRSWATLEGPSFGIIK